MRFVYALIGVLCALMILRSEWTRKMRKEPDGEVFVVFVLVETLIGWPLVIALIAVHRIYTSYALPIEEE